MKAHDLQSKDSLTAPIPTPTPRPDSGLIATFWAVMNPPPELREVRIPKSRKGPARLFGPASGYFNAQDKFVAALSSLRGEDAEAVYVTLNPCNPELRARADNRLVQRPAATTSDTAITRRTRLLIDVDPVRPSGVSAKNAEMAAALAVRDAIREYLTDQGWPAPLIASETGSGGGLIYGVDLPNDDTSTGLVQAVLAALAALFDTAEAKIDKAVFNAARITKVIGTVAARGDHVPDIGRIWRLATGTFNPDARPILRDRLAAVAALAPTPTSIRQAAPGAILKSVPGARTWTVAELLERNEIGFCEKRRTYGTAYVLDRCLTSDAHSDGAVIIEFASHALSYRCLHDTCRGRRWEDVRPTLGLGNGNGTAWPAEPADATPLHVSTFSRKEDQREDADDVDSDPAPPTFPTDALPEPVATYVSESARAIGGPEDLVGAPLLANAGAVIGSCRFIELKPGFWQRPILYIGTVAAPGSLKTPGGDAARYPLDVLQKEAMERYERELEIHERETERWLAADKQSRGDKPEPPVLEHFFTTDTTLEALAAILGGKSKKEPSVSPGVVLSRDEIVGWVKACDAYRGGRGGDRQQWLSLWAGSPLKVDRKGSRPTYVPHPTVCVAGGVQPELLPELADEAGRRDGFIERILWSYPVVPPAGWTEDSVSDTSRQRIVSLFRRLRQVDPEPVRLSLEARSLWTQWFNENSRLTAEASGLAQGIYAKMPNQLARLALIVHCLTHPGLSSSRVLDADTMNAGIELAEYFRSHA